MKMSLLSYRLLAICGLVIGCAASALAQGSSDTRLGVNLPELGPKGSGSAVSSYITWNTSYFTAAEIFTLNPAGPPPPTRITLENLALGSTGWTVPWSGYTVSDDINLQVKGYTGSESVAPGGILPLKVTVNPVQKYTIDVFRLGYYQGLGGRLMEHLGPFAGIRQPTCTIDSTYLMNVCQWSTSVALQVPQYWISGVYVAVVTNASKFQSLIPFWVVEPNRRSEMLYLSSLNTYEAYNDFPHDPLPSNPRGAPKTGHSMYTVREAVKVSFDRPFSGDGGADRGGGLLHREQPLIAFLERLGYDVTYANEQVIDAQPSLLQGHKVIALGGHPEYQTMANYNALISARDVGVGLAFISSNEVYWQVRYEPNAGVDRRVMVCYKAVKADPIANPSLRTTRWRDLGRPEQKLVGVQFEYGEWNNGPGQPWSPKSTNHWAFAGTRLQDGIPLNAEIDGYEIDSYNAGVGLPKGTDFTLLSASSFVHSPTLRFTQNSSIYRSLAGNWVWATGTMDWSWGISRRWDGSRNVQPSLQLMTRTILDRMMRDAPSGL